MQTTFNNKEWQEDPILDRQRTSLTSRSDPDEFRRLYPFKVRILKPCKAYNFDTGAIVKYARTKMTPQYFPMEAVFIRKEGSIESVQHMYFNSDEAELLEA